MACEGLRHGHTKQKDKMDSSNQQQGHTGKRIPFKWLKRKQPRNVFIRGKCVQVEKSHFSQHD